MNPQLNKNQINKINLSKAILINPKSFCSNNQENNVESQKKCLGNDYVPDINIQFARKNNADLNCLQGSIDKNLYFIDENYYKNLEESLFSHVKKYCKSKSKNKINKKDKKHKKEKVKSHSAQKIEAAQKGNNKKEQNIEGEPQIYKNKKNEKKQERDENKKKIKNMINRVYSIENKQFKSNDELNNYKTPKFYKHCQSEIIHQESKLNFSKNKEGIPFPSKTDNKLINSICNNLESKCNHLDNNNCFNINTLNNYNINLDNKDKKCAISDKNNIISNIQLTKKNIDNEQFKGNINVKTTQKLIKSNYSIKKKPVIKNIFAKCIPFCITTS